MLKAAGRSDCLPAHSEERRMLVLGYHGTLEREPEDGGVPEQAASGWSGDGFAESGVTPPQMEELTEPWVAKAQGELERRIPAGRRVFSGEGIPLDGLLVDLRRRLQGVLTLAVGEWLAKERLEGTECDLGKEFPGLEWLLKQAASEWVTAAVTFCERLQRDASRLAAWIGIDRLPRVGSVSGSTADTHPGGHAVLRVVFEGGHCVYYKPRGVTGEWLWHELLEAIAQLEPGMRLPAGRVLEGGIAGRYGWMESVRPEDRNEVGTDGAGYWYAAGAMLCLAYHAALTDLHLGNLLATPGGPVVTDAECLGTPCVLAGLTRARVGEAAEAREFLGNLLETGLLPGRTVVDLPDISGLFGSSGPVSKVGLPNWVRKADGRYRLAMAGAYLREHGNATGNDAGGARPLAVAPKMLDGYREAAGLLVRVRGELTDLGSKWRYVLEHAHAPRIVVRDTLTYGLLLSQSLRPSGLGGGYCRRITLLRALQEERPDGCPASVLRAELHALLGLHVPRLILLPGTRSLAKHSGRLLACNFASRTPGEEVLRRMGELSAAHVEGVQVPAVLGAMLHR